LEDKMKKSEYQKLGDAVAYFYGKKANIDEVCNDSTLGWDPKRTMTMTYKDLTSSIYPKKKQI